METQGAWMGTVLVVPGQPSPVVVAYLSILLIAVRVVSGVALFAHTLRHRPRFAARCVLLCAAVGVAVGIFLLASHAAGPVEPVVGYAAQLLSFSLILVLCVIGILFLCDTSVWTALFCATEGYTLQNLSTGATELVAVVARALGADPTEFAFYMTNEVICLGVTLALGYALLARKMDREGLAQMESHQIALMMPAVSLAVIGFDVTIKSVTELVPLASIVAFRLLHGLACVAVLWIEYQMLYRARIEQERAATERLLAERERQYQLSRETIDAINVKCHDLRHQIRSLGAGGAVVDGAALDDLARDVSIYDSTVRTGNDALDTILTEKQLMCERRGITLTCIADGSALGFMAPADIYALFGNALDNAIEAVGQLEDPARRSISLVVRQALGSVSIHVENYFDRTAGELRFSDGLPQTTKPDRENHGFGVRSMRQTAERYSGSFSTAAQNDVFTLDVLIPMPAA